MLDLRMATFSERTCSMMDIRYTSDKYKIGGGCLWGEE